MRVLSRWIVFIVFVLPAAGCITPKINLFPDATRPLEEFTLQGGGGEKILVLNIQGMIANETEEGLIREKPSMVQELVSHLQKAAGDKNIKALLIKVDSPGGTATASDIIYHEITAFKEKTGAKIVVSMMGIAASGGVYVSLPADRIFAHPTTITGSVGVFFARVGVTELMGKLGIEVEVNKAGRNKDMGSPFRETTVEEERILQDMVEGLGKRFYNLVRKHRNPAEEAFDRIRTGRIFLADEALALGLIDEIGYVSDALEAAKTLADLPDNPRVVIYRRSEYRNDNIYNRATTRTPAGKINLAGEVLPKRTGMYYLWTP